MDEKHGQEADFKTSFLPLMAFLKSFNELDMDQSSLL